MPGADSFVNPPSRFDANITVESFEKLGCQVQD